MTFGKKLKKYRKLRNMTQKELGDAALKVKSAENKRISQYESDEVVPGDDIKQNLIECVKADKELFNINIDSEEDIMAALFDIEDKYNVEVTAKDGKVTLTFDNSEKNSTLYKYLAYWASEIPRGNSTKEERKKYDVFLSQFFTHFREYVDNLERDDNYILKMNSETFEGIVSAILSVKDDIKIKEEISGNQKYLSIESANHPENDYKIFIKKGTDDDKI